jgi:hypothetical protein
VARWSPRILFFQFILVLARLVESLGTSGTSSTVKISRADLFVKKLMHSEEENITSSHREPTSALPISAEQSYYQIDKKGR